MLVDRDRASVDAVCEGLAKSNDHSCATIDVTVEAGWIQTLDTLNDRYGRLDIVVNNAGWSRLLPLADCSLKDWNGIVAVDLDAAFLGMKMAMPMLASGNRGAIVNMSSVRSDVAGAGAAAYSAAKSGMAALARVVAIEWAQTDNGVRVNTIHSGFVATSFSRNMATPAQIEAFAQTCRSNALRSPRRLPLWQLSWSLTAPATVPAHASSSMADLAWSEHKDEKWQELT
jgi:NAD(P)-dependent dehydrogenase (short-subunit alcohol dehydrogenase family)